MSSSLRPRAQRLLLALGAAAIVTVGGASAANADVPKADPPGTARITPGLFGQWALPDFRFFTLPEVDPPAPSDLDPWRLKRPGCPSPIALCLPPGGF